MEGKFYDGFEWESVGGDGGLGGGEVAGERRGGGNNNEGVEILCLC